MPRLRINGFGALLLAAGALCGQDTVDYFRQNCSSCHTIGGGRLTGPDLKNVAQRKDRGWLVDFMLSPQGMIDKGDPYALKLQQDARGVVMPVVSGIDRARAEALLNLIEAESKLPKSQFMGLQISDRPFTQTDYQQGMALFSGTRRLAKGAPACIGCHTVGSLGGLGGGRLGPDLTRVFERLQGRKNLAVWLSAPATPTMSAVLKGRALAPEEILPLVAVFETEAKQPPRGNPAAPLTFLLLGLGAAVLGLVACDSAWKRRFQSVRAALVGKRGER